MFIDKFSVALSFQNLKNVGISILELKYILTFLLLFPLQIIFRHTFEGTDKSTKKGSWVKRRI